MNTETNTTITQPAAHTPGPWHTQADLTGETLAVYAEPRVVPGCARDTFNPLVARVYDGDVYFNRGTLSANACLIAAAPETTAERDRLKKINAELLEALKHARRLVASRDVVLDRAALKMYDAAIAKAQGGAM